jgi:hypothetical protein
LSRLRSQSTRAELESASGKGHVPSCGPELYFPISGANIRLLQSLQEVLYV